MEDRIKEALFSILGERVLGARVLDLFCGSGSLGIEALSRGAESSAFVDSYSASVAAVRRNLEHTDLAVQARVYHSEVRKWLAQRRPSARRHPERAVNLIFLDPPFRISRQELAAILDELASTELLAAEATIILQQPARDEQHHVPGLDLADRRLYGDSALVFYRRVAGGGDIG